MGKPLEFIHPPKCLSLTSSIDLVNYYDPSLYQSQSQSMLDWGFNPVSLAFQPQAGTQAGTQFKQGIERYNVTPWVIPVGFKLGLTF